MRTINYCLMYFLTFFLLSSCETEKSSDVNQNRIYTRYTLTYETTANKTTARARFRFGNRYGTQLELEAPSSITLNNEALQFKPVFSYYEKTFSGKIAEGTFNWTSFDGEEYTNSIVLSEIGFPADLTEISQDSSYNLHWVGKALEKNEYVKLSINGNLEDDASTVSISTEGSSSITISQAKLQILPVDQEANFVLEFGYNPPLTQETSAGGIILGRYRVSKKITIH